MNYRHPMMPLLIALAVIGVTACNNGGTSDRFASSTPAAEVAATSSSTTPVPTAPIGESTTSTPPPSPLKPDECTALKDQLDAGPTNPVGLGALTVERRQAIVSELEGLVAETPEPARSQMETFATAYRQVLDILAAAPDLTELTPVQQQQIEAIMSTPDVASATATIESWTTTC